VVVSGSPTTNPTRLVDAGEPLRVLGPPPPYVSRAGGKLRAALDRFGVDPTGLRAVDVGASTGGFTDCLLQAGATHVVAVDVGRGQLHERLRSDPRVESRERTDVRSLTPDDVGGPADLLSVDVAFVALRTVLPAVVGLARPGAHLLLLVKPQFEADAADVAKGRGVVRDPVVWAVALSRAVDALDRLGAAIMGGMVSPLRGADGNVEFVLHALAPDGDDAPGVPPLDVEALVAEATDVTTP
jgi:23S rRNA (cytidine1920-2'-O)/16S rRNA (cytidine1409-2'-O)-methyltransferase